MNPNGGFVSVNEELQIEGTSWADFHEKILTPGWNWGSQGLLLAKKPGENNFSIPSGFSAMLKGPELWYFFDPLPEGTTIRITKDAVTNGPFTGQVRIEEYPTTVPESSTNLSFLAFGVLGTASILKRKLKPSKSTSLLCSKKF